LISLFKLKVVKKVVNATIYTVLYIALIVASVSTSAHFFLNYFSDLGKTSTTLVSDLGAKKKTIVPLVVDQFLKSADSQQTKTIHEYRSNITIAITHLLSDSHFKFELSAALDPISKALRVGKSSAIIDTRTIAKIIAHAVNSSAGKTAITSKNLASISTKKVIDLGKVAKAFHNITSIITTLMFSWFIVILMVTLLFVRKRLDGIRILAKMLISLGIPILLIWLGLPRVAISLVNSHAQSQLAALLFPIGYREVTGFTEQLGIIYLIIGVLMYVVFRIITGLLNLKVVRTRKENQIDDLSAA
jgi:hypothetical protein